MRIFISGGSSGLGKQLVQTLALNLENEIVFTYNRTKPTEEILKQNVIAIQTDFSNKEDLQRIGRFLSENDFDCLINNYHAGYQYGHITKHSSKDALSSFATSVAPIIDLTNSFASKAKTAGRGQIINVLSSVTLSGPVLGMAIYSAEKRYLEEVGRHWAMELNKFGINITAISPKLLETGFNKHLDSRLIEVLKAQGEFSDMSLVVEKILEVLAEPKSFHGKNILA